MPVVGIFWRESLLDRGSRPVLIRGLVSATLEDCAGTRHTSGLFSSPVINRLQNLSPDDKTGND